MQTGRLTEVYGQFKSGKTNFAHTTAVTVQLPKERGGLNGEVAFIDTENTFSKEKIKRIAKRFGLDPAKVVSKIFHARIYSSDHQNQMVLKAEQYCRNNNVKLVIVDSLIALMRAEYIGIGMLAKRQGVLNNMIHALSRLAERFNCAILATNQVATKMMGMFSADDAIGENIVAHGFHFRMMFKNKGFSSNNSLKRRAIIVDAPDLPPDECEFFITSMGIVDTEKVESTSSSVVKKKINLDEILENSEEKAEPIEKEFLNPSLDEVSIKGLGPNSIDKLKIENVKSIRDLMEASPKDIASKISGFTEKKVSEWQKQAKELAKS